MLYARPHSKCFGCTLPFSLHSSPEGGSHFNPIAHVCMCTCMYVCIHTCLMYVLCLMSFLDPPIARWGWYCHLLHFAGEESTDFRWKRRLHGGGGTRTQINPVTILRTPLVLHYSWEFSIFPCSFFFYSLLLGGRWLGLFGCRLLEGQATG